MIRLADGAVLAKLGGTYWDTGQMHTNRHDLMAAWSPDSRAVIEVANSRWDTDSLVYYLLEGATATTLDLRALVEPAMKAKLPPKKRESNSFRVREDLPVKLDASGHARLAQCFMCRREKRASTYKVQIDIVRETRQEIGRAHV